MSRIARRLAATALFAASGALGAPTLVIAEDAVWDIEAYDACMAKTVRVPDLCCIESGGVPTGDSEDTQSDGAPNCYAPTAETAGGEGERGTRGRRPLGATVLDDLSTAPASSDAPTLRRPAVRAPDRATTTADPG